MHYGTSTTLQNILAIHTLHSSLMRFLRWAAQLTSRTREQHTRISHRKRKRRLRIWSFCIVCGSLERLRVRDMNRVNMSVRLDLVRDINWFKLMHLDVRYGFPSSPPFPFTLPFYASALRTRVVAY